MKLKNNILKSVCRRPLAVLAFSALALYGCEIDSDLDLPLALNAGSYQLDAIGGNTNVMVYSTGKWHVKLEYPVNWASLSRIIGEGNGDFNFAYSQNYGAARRANVLVSRGDRVDTVKMIQLGVNPSLAFSSSSVTLNKTGERTGIPVRTNLKHNLDEISVECIYEDEYAEEWLTELELTADSLFFTPLTNDTGTSRSVKVQLSFTDGLDQVASASVDLVQANADIRRVTFGEVRAMITEAAGEKTINDPVIVLEGIVISDKDNPNMETNPNTASQKIDFTVNNRTAYIQSADGKYGFRINTVAESDNVLKRYSAVTLSLNGLTLVKESNPTRYTLKGLTVDHITEAVDGSLGNLADKRKYMDELTDDDMYTYVKLRNVEISISDGAYTNVNDGYQIKTDWNPKGCSPSFFDCYPLNIRDKRGNSMYALFNGMVKWRRVKNAGVPRGSGTFSGILVHTELPRYGKNGQIGTYSIRPLEEGDVALEKDRGNGFSEVLVEWTWNAGVGVSGTALTSEIGDGVLRQTENKNLGGTNDFNNKDNTTATKGLAGNCGIYAGSKWWNFDENRGEGFQIEFSTTGVSSDNLALMFSIGSGSGSAASSLAPTYWEVQYSVDGTNFTTLPNSTFVVRPLVWWNNALPTWICPGNIDYAFNLPVSLLGQPKVYVRMVAQSTVCANAGASDPEGGNVTPSTGNMNVRLGCVSVRYNKQ